MIENKKGKNKNKESPESWWGLVVLVIVLILSIGTYLLWPEKPPADDKKTAVAQVVDYPLCANGEYNFSNLDIKKAKYVVIKISSTCLANVILPDSCWQSDPTVDVEKIWADGSKSYDGPNMLVIGENNGKKIFFVRGLRESGTMKISFVKS